MQDPHAVALLDDDLSDLVVCPPGAGGIGSPRMVFVGIHRSRPPRFRPATSPASSPRKRARIASTAADARTPATRRAYAAQWQAFERWCAARATATLAVLAGAGRRLPRRAGRALEAGHGRQPGAALQQRVP